MGGCPLPTPHSRLTLSCTPKMNRKWVLLMSISNSSCVCVYTCAAVLAHVSLCMESRGGCLAPPSVPLYHVVCMGSLTLDLVYRQDGLQDEGGLGTGLFPALAVTGTHIRRAGVQTDSTGCL